MEQYKLNPYREMPLMKKNTGNIYGGSRQQK